ncbi:UNVERIFIED_CONTAM: hypothetical protein GTU68_003751 [Idotea baltica]|nr:hypothetical protein [Idotea baltica]
MERPFACRVCSKRFMLNEHLRIHMRTHTGEKPFACPSCHRRFSQSGSLSKHLERNVCRS